jgi:hypothetical protein
LDVSQGRSKMIYTSLCPSYLQKGRPVLFRDIQTVGQQLSDLPRGPAFISFNLLDGSYGTADTASQFFLGLVERFAPSPNITTKGYRCLHQDVSLVIIPDIFLE